MSLGSLVRLANEQRGPARVQLLAVLRARATALTLASRGGAFRVHDSAADRRAAMALWPDCALCGRRVGVFSFEATATGLRITARCHGAEDVREVGPEVLVELRAGGSRLVQRPIAFDLPQIGAAP